MIELAHARILGGQVYAALLETTKVVLDICKRKRRTIVLYVKNVLLTVCTLSTLKKKKQENENNKRLRFLIILLVLDLLLHSKT